MIWAGFAKTPSEIASCARQGTPSPLDGEN
jgi:hypothetical protein